MLKAQSLPCQTGLDCLYLCGVQFLFIMARVDHIALGHFKTQLRLFMKTVGLFDLHHWPW